MQYHHTNHLLASTHTRAHSAIARILCRKRHITTYCLRPPTALTHQILPQEILPGAASCLATPAPLTRRQTPGQTSSAKIPGNPSGAPTSPHKLFPTPARGIQNCIQNTSPLPDDFVLLFSSASDQFHPAPLLEFFGSYCVRLLPAAWHQVDRVGRSSLASCRYSDPHDPRQPGFLNLLRFWSGLGFFFAGLLQSQ